VAVAALLQLAAKTDLPMPSFLRTPSSVRCSSGGRIDGRSLAAAVGWFMKNISGNIFRPLAAVGRNASKKLIVFRASVRPLGADRSPTTVPNRNRAFRPCGNPQLQPEEVHQSFINSAPEKR
jgi:hypothetical protein